MKVKRVQKTVGRIAMTLFARWPAGEYLISFCILLNGRLTTFNLYRAFISKHNYLIVVCVSVCEEAMERGSCTRAL